MTRARRRWRWHSIVSTVVVLAAIGVGGCGDPSPEPESKGPSQVPDPIGEATLAAAGDMLVPGSGPPGLTARLVQRGGAPTPGGAGDDARLYSDASGQRVVVLYQHGSDVGMAPDGLEEEDGSVGDSRAYVAEVAGGWWVRWFARRREP